MTTARCALSAGKSVGASWHRHQEPQVKLLASFKDHCRNEGCRIAGRSNWRALQNEFCSGPAHVIFFSLMLNNRSCYLINNYEQLCRHLCDTCRSSGIHFRARDSRPTVDNFQTETGERDPEILAGARRRSDRLGRALIKSVMSDFCGRADMRRSSCNVAF